MTFLETAVVFDQFPRIVTDHFRNAVACVAHRFDGWIVFHHGSRLPK